MAANGNKSTGGSASAVKGEGGFFTIRRRGQGKWTRVGTAVGATIIIVGGALFIFYDVRAAMELQEQTALITAGLFALLIGLLAFWIQNKPNNVAFLIDTDSEMKKVNWATRKELIGSTKVVIAFMLILAFMLFVVDMIFGYIFYFLGVMKIQPRLFEVFFN